MYNLLAAILFLDICWETVEFKVHYRAVVILQEISPKSMHKFKEQRQKYRKSVNANFSIKVSSH